MKLLRIIISIVSLLGICCFGSYIYAQNRKAIKDGNAAALGNLSEYKVDATNQATLNVIFRNGEYLSGSNLVGRAINELARRGVQATNQTKAVINISFAGEPKCAVLFREGIGKPLKFIVFDANGDVKEFFSGIAQEGADVDMPK